MKWESGSSKTNSSDSEPFSVRGTGSKYSFVDELLLSGLSNPGLAVKEEKKKEIVDLGSFHSYSYPQLLYAMIKWHQISLNHILL